MAEPVEIPDEIKQQMGNVAVTAPETDPFAVLEGLNEEVSPPVEPEPEEEEKEDEAAPAGEPAEEATDSRPAITHPPELIERATILAIPADEVAEMSTAELRRVVKHADRVGQAVNDYHVTKQPVTTQPAPEKPQEADILAVLDDEEKIHPDLAKVLKPLLSKVLDDNRAVREETKQIKAATQATSQKTLHSQLMAQVVDIEPELVKSFDLATGDGQRKYQELLNKMGADQRDNPKLSEKRLLHRAIKAMELVPEKPKEAPATTAEKKRWSDNALAQPNSRKGKESLGDIVGRIMANDQRNAKRTNGQAAKLPQ